jgi:transcriptional regulator with XRE-family HTH domain
MASLQSNIAYKAIIGKQIASPALPWRHIQPKNLPMNIGMVIRALRVECGLTQEELALAADVATSNISRIENGKRNPSVDLLERLALALGTTASAVYSAAEGKRQPKSSSALLRDGIHEDYSRNAQSLLRHFRELTPENQHMTIAYVKMLKGMQG